MISKTNAPAQPQSFTSDTADTSWRESVRSDAVECVEPKTFRLLDGSVPFLRGSYLRNGPGQLNVHGMPLKNLIDGAGFAQSVKFDDSGVHLRSRFVQTATKKREDRAKKALFGGFSQLCPRGTVGHLRGASLRYTANTNLVAHAGKLYALYENDWPYRLSADDLRTESHDNLGLLSRKQRFSAHPKLDAETGDMHNVGCEYNYRLGWGAVSASTRLWFYKIPAQRAPTSQAFIDLPYPAALVHDMALTPRHTVAVVSPLVLRPTLSVVLGLKAADQAICWDDRLPSLLVMHERETNTIHTHRYSPTLCFHMVNAFETDDDELVVDTCDFSGGDVVRITSDMVQGRSVEHHRAQLNRLRRSSAGIWKSQPLSDTPLDWPRVSPGYAGRRYQYIFGNTWDNHSPLPDVPVRIDIKNNVTTRFSLARPYHYAGEPLPVKKPGRLAECDVYVLSMVFESGLAGHVLHIWDGANPESAALCRLQSPSSLPYGFHTNWLDENDVRQCALPS